MQKEQEVTEEGFIGLLKIHTGAFVQIGGKANVSDGWKISVQGKTLEDSDFLFKNLIELITVTKAPFKFATQRLIDLNNEQSTKLLTIYIPNGVDAKSYAELVRLNIEGYTGADDIEEKRSYTKYATGIFFRNDRDSSGEYIPA